MNSRRNRIDIRLNDLEYEKLMKDVQKSGANISDYIRKLILEKEIKEKPDYEFYKVMNQLTKIGVNLNQIAHKANATNVIDKNEYKKAEIEWQKFAKEVKQKFL